MNDCMTVRQTACFCAISMLALKLVALPSILTQQITSSAIIVTTFLIFFDFLMLFIFLKIKEKYPEMSLYELLQKFLGTIVAKTIYVFLFIFFFCKLSLLMNESVTYMKDVVDEEFKVVIFLFTFMSVITALVYTGLKSTARTCEFGFVFVLIGLIVCLFLSEIDLNFGEIGPLFKETPLKIFQTAFDVSFWFSDFLFVVIIADKIKPQKKMKQTIFTFVFFIGLILMILYIIYFRLFRVTGYLHKTAIADITQYNKNIGNAGNIDIIAILVYLFIIFFQGSLYLTCLKVIYEKIIGYENRVHSLIVLNLLIISCQYFLLFNLQRIVNLSLLYLKYFSVLVWVVIPIYYICLLIFDKEKKDDKSYKRKYKTG